MQRRHVIISLQSHPWPATWTLQLPDSKAFGRFSTTKNLKDTTPWGRIFLWPFLLSVLVNIHMLDRLSSHAYRFKWRTLCGMLFIFLKPVFLGTCTNPQTSHCSLTVCVFLKKILQRLCAILQKCSVWDDASGRRIFQPIAETSLYKRPRRRESCISRLSPKARQCHRLSLFRQITVKRASFAAQSALKAASKEFTTAQAETSSGWRWAKGEKSGG